MNFSVSNSVVLLSRKQRASEGVFMFEGCVMCEGCVSV